VAVEEGDRAMENSHSVGTVTVIADIEVEAA
jgi:hypothetical protein